MYNKPYVYWYYYYYFLLVTWLLNIWTVSNKNINHDRVWVLGLGECDSGTEDCKVCRGEEVSARVCYSQKLWKPLPDSEKSVWDGPMTCHQWETCQRKGLSLGKIVVSCLKELRSEVFVCVITYWFGSIRFFSCSLCGPQARLGLLPEAMGRPGPRGFLIINLCCDQAE